MGGAWGWVGPGEIISNAQLQLRCKLLISMNDQQERKIGNTKSEAKTKSKTGMKMPKRNIWSMQTQVKNGMNAIETIVHEEDDLPCALCHEKPRMPSTRRTSLVNRRESSTGSRSSNASSCGSCVQPSIGIPLASFAT